jgi:DNA-binding HxlR family transcriptional regulator
MPGRTPDLLAALGKRDGQQVLARLAQRPACVGELADRFAAIQQPTVSRRLAELEAIGLVDHRQKKGAYYLTQPARLRPLLREDRRRRDTGLWAALGRPQAVEIMLALIRRPMRSDELADALDGIDPRTLARRLAELASVGAVRRDNVTGVHRVVDRRRVSALLRSFSNLATELITADLAAERSIQQRLAIEAAIVRSRS